MNPTLTAVAIIPARYDSSRFPGKPLAQINGKPMIEYVWRAAMQAESLSAVYIATDDERIRACAAGFGAQVLKPHGAFASGTDRIIGALALLDAPADIVVNIQGDEPLLRGGLVDELVHALADRPEADVSTPVRRIVSAADIEHPAIVKVARAADGRALYFSRSPIPFRRDADQAVDYFQHIGLYAYRRRALERFGSLSTSPLERAEQLEQLRLMEDGAHYYCIECTDELYAVDQPEDVRRVEEILTRRGDSLDS